MLLCALFLVCGCGLQQELKQRNKLRLINHIKSDIIYFQDEKTGICYAVFEHNSGEISFTAVPYEKVKNYLVANNFNQVKER